MCHDKVPLPDLVFLNINMPRMNGFECLQRLCELYSPKELPVVMYTTSGQQSAFSCRLCAKRSAKNYFLYSILTKSKEIIITLQGKHQINPI